MAKPTQDRVANTVSSLGEDRVWLLIILLIGSALVALLFVGPDGEEIRPERDGLVTVQQPSGWDKVRRAVGLGESLPAPRGDTPGRQIGEGLRLAPQTFNGEVIGYVIGADTDAALLAKAKFRPGDLLMTMDGRSLDQARIEALGDELSLLDAVEVTFMRDGATRKRVVNLRPAA